MEIGAARAEGAEASHQALHFTRPDAKTAIGKKERGRIEGSPALGWAGRLRRTARSGWAGRLRHTAFGDSVTAGQIPAEHLGGRPSQRNVALFPPLPHD